MPSRWRDRDWSGWGEYGPRRAAQGIRAQTRRGAFGKTWWAGRWLRALEQLVDEGRLSRGRSYARSGQVVSLDVDRGSVKAAVQGSQPRPYKVEIRVAQLDAETWNAVYDAMAAEALYAAELLSGRMPSAIEDAFAAAGATLFPNEGRELESSCSCPDWSNPCKHIAAVFYLLGEQFDADPFLMFMLRGRSAEEVAAALRLRRGDSDAEGAGASGPAPEPEVPLLEGDPRAFWRARGESVWLAPDFRAPSLDALAVRSLGPPPFWTQPQPWDTVVADLYRTIASNAREIALGSEAGETAPEG